MIKIMLLQCLVVCHSAWALSCNNLVTVSSGEGAHWASKVAVDGDGTTAVVAWVKEVENNEVLQAAVRLNDQPHWNSPSQVSELAKIKTITLYAGGDGVTSVIWKVNNGNGYYFSKKEKEGHWSTGAPIRIQDYPLIWSVDFDLQGNPFVLASKEKEKGPEVYSFHPGIDEEDPAKNPLLVTNSQNELPQIIRNGRGDIVAWYLLLGDSTAWYVKSKSDRYFCAHLYDSSKKKWTYLKRGPYMNIYPEQDNVQVVSGISVAMNNSQQIALIWSQHENKINEPYYLNTIMDSQVEGITRCDDYFRDSTVSIDDQGNAVAVWVQTDDRKQVLYASFRPQSGRWSAPKSLSEISSDAGRFGLSYYKDSFVVVWEEKASDESSKIYGSSLQISDHDKKWSESTLLSPPDQNCWYPSIAFSEKGGLITWTTHVKQSPNFQIQVAELLIE